MPERAGAPFGPARWLVQRPAVVERSGDRVRAVAGGRRLELEGEKIMVAGPDAPGVADGARAPAWVKGSAPYVFWKGADLYAADTFMGPLRRLGVVPGEPRSAFPWLDGTGIQLDGGAVVITGSGRHGAGVAAVTLALAADARRALAITAFGHAWLTLDGGASYRDVSAELGGATGLDVSGGALVVTLPDGRRRAVTASGAIVDAPQEQRLDPPESPDPFFVATRVEPLEAAIRSGLPLEDGDLVITAHGFVARLDPKTLRTRSVAALDAGLGEADCAPVRIGAELLVACVGPDRAAVLDLEGAPRTERTFDLAGASDLDRFVAGGDEAFGYLGPCDGAPVEVPDVEVGPSGEAVNASRQRSPVFCARAGRDAWVEHRLLPDEAGDVVAWTPRPGGAAVALVAPSQPFLESGTRVVTRGGLRVVRLMRGETALSPGNDYDRPFVVDRSLRARANGALVGWLGTGGPGTNAAAIEISEAGVVRTYAGPPDATRIERAGLLALAAGEDGRLWETVDGGKHWAAVAPAPFTRDQEAPAVVACSLAGCDLGDFARLGWTGAPGPEPREGHADTPIFRAGAAQRPDGPLVLRLACSPAGRPEGRHVVDSGVFGFTPTAQPQAALVRIGALGFASFPWAGTGVNVATGDVDVTWLPPLDPSAALVRRSVPVAPLGLPPDGRRPHDQSLGYLMARDGKLGVFAATGRDGCGSTWLDLAGVTRPLGACAEDASVGVDLGGRIIVVHATDASIEVSRADTRTTNAPARAKGLDSLHLLHATPVGASARGFSIGAGERAGAPVVVAVDVNGEAVLAPIDPSLGTLGAEEPLLPLRSAELGSSAACAARAGDARVVLPFEGAIALERGALPGVAPAAGDGVAVIRWSRLRACVDALQIPVRDERFDEAPAQYEAAGTLHAIVARFDRPPRATLVLVAPGSETRQPLACTKLAP
jgi:hypothetical protein